MALLLVNPDSSTKAYQGLAKTCSVIEPPTWSLLLAESCRKKGFQVGLFDCDAKRLTLGEGVRRIDEINPPALLFVLYAKIRINDRHGRRAGVGEAVRQTGLVMKVAFVGSHGSSLPLDVLLHDCVDIFLLNEGTCVWHNLLRETGRTN